MGEGGGRQLYGLIGYPVRHSYSAFMHNAAFRHYKMNAEYMLFEIPPEQLEEFFKKTIFEKPIRGFNVTIPHKEKAVDFLTGSISHNVRMSRAANTVRVEKDGELSGFNTDGPGFSRDLNEQGVEVSGTNVSLIGAGGGAKAIAPRIASYKPKRFLVYDIQETKATELVGLVKEFYPTVRIESVNSLQDLRIKESGLLVNATPVGMRESDPLLVKRDWLHRGLFVYDLIYNPGETKLLKAAKEVGCRYANGLGMLLYQGCYAFQHWTGKEPPVDVMRRALMEKMHV